MHKGMRWLGLLLGLSVTYGCGDPAALPHADTEKLAVESSENPAANGKAGIFRKSEWDFENAPEQMGLSSDDYEVDFASLPLSGALSVTPWSGWYWPTYSGGISYRWNHDSEDDNDRVYYDLLDWEALAHVDLSQLSPSEKYDVYMGHRDWRLTRRERTRTDVMATLQGKDIPFWEGLCDVWAEATLTYKNPAPVTLQGPGGIPVPFGSADIQALLAYNLHLTEARTYFASRRCDVDESELSAKLQQGEINQYEYDELMESADCRGVNPGAFHVILANMIALRNQGFIADVTRDLQVWNQAVHGYRSTIVAERRSGFSPQAAPGTVREVLMRTAMVYTIEITNSWERVVTPISNRELTYEYWLELDANDAIIGGAWVSSQRPDFLWKRDLSGFEGFMRPLKTIYEESVKDLGDQSPAASAHKQFGKLRWHLEEGYVLSDVSVSGRAPAGVAKLVLRAYDPAGILSVSHDVPMNAQGTFLRQISVLRWYTGKIVLIGFDRQGHELLQAEMKKKT